MNNKKPNTGGNTKKTEQPAAIKPRQGTSCRQQRCPKLDCGDGVAGGERGAVARKAATLIRRARETNNIPEGVDTKAYRLKKSEDAR